jgi:hypothetical protein
MFERHLVEAAFVFGYVAAEGIRLVVRCCDRLYRWRESR